MPNREPEGRERIVSRRILPAGGPRRPIAPGVRVDAPGNAGRPDRIAELDGLRGLACLAILVYHLKARLLPVGWAAVDLFFVLSGYLITAILLTSRGAKGALPEFYRRRARRIWPVYYLAVLAIAAAGPWLPRPSRMGGLGYYLTFTQNLPRLWSSEASDFSPYLAHFWSLAIEAQFYLVWPLFVLIGGRIGAVAGSIGLVAMSVWARSRGADPWLLVARCDALALGGLLAVVIGSGGQGAHRKRDWKWIFGAVAVASGVYLGWLGVTGNLPRGGRSLPGAPDSILAVACLGFAIVGLALAGSGGRGSAWLRDRRLGWVGKVSFGLYVYHYIVYFLANDILDRLGFRGRPVWQDAIKLGLSFTLAAFSWRYLERPILDLGKRRSDAGKRAAGAESRPKTLAADRSRP